MQITCCYSQNLDNLLTANHLYIFWNFIDFLECSSVLCVVGLFVKAENKGLGSIKIRLLDNAPEGGDECNSSAKQRLGYGKINMALSR